MYLLCLFLGIACLWDYSTGKIPNFLQFNLMSIGIIYSFCLDGWKGILWFTLRVLIIGAIMFPMFMLSMIGGGDVKIIALASGYFQTGKILWFIFYLMICAAVIALGKLLIDRNSRSRWIHFFKYIYELLSAGKVMPYHANYGEQIKSSVVMSGPILFSALLAWGGVY